MRLLIANRGENALRTNRTAHHLGIRTIAIFAEHEEPAPHVRSAHDAYRICDSEELPYVRLDRILEIARLAGAIHPGCGLLTGSDTFVAARDLLSPVKSMKMANEIVAPRAGTIASVHVGIGSRVPRGQPRVSMDV